MFASTIARTEVQNVFWSVVGWIGWPVRVTLYPLTGVETYVPELLNDTVDAPRVEVTRTVIFASVAIHARYAARAKKWCIGTTANARANASCDAELRLTTTKCAARRRGSRSPGRYQTAA